MLCSFSARTHITSIPIPARKHLVELVLLEAVHFEALRLHHWPDLGSERAQQSGHCSVTPPPVIHNSLPGLSVISARRQRRSEIDVRIGVGFLLVDPVQISVSYFPLRWDVRTSGPLGDWDEERGSGEECDNCVYTNNSYKSHLLRCDCDWPAVELDRPTQISGEQAAALTGVLKPPNLNARRSHSHVRLRVCLPGCFEGVPDVATKAWIFKATKFLKEIGSTSITNTHYHPKPLSDPCFIFNSAQPFKKTAARFFLLLNHDNQQSTKQRQDLKPLIFIFKT